MLRCYGLSKEPFSDQGVRTGSSQVVTFGDVAHEVFRWLNELLYPDGNTYESTAVETSTGLYFSATEKDGGEEVYALDFDTNTALSVVMPKSIAPRHQVSYALFCLLAYHWYGEQQLRVMCANIKPAVWRRAFYLFGVIMGVNPIDCRSGSSTHELIMYFEPEPAADFVAPQYALLDGGIGSAGSEQARQLLIASSGLGLIDLDETPDDRFNPAVYENIGIQPLRIVRDEVQAPPSVVLEPETVPLADPVDVLYHKQFAECRDILLAEPRMLLMHSVDGGTGKSRIVQQLATTLAVPYVRIYRLITMDGDVHPEFVHAYLNGGLVHLAVDVLAHGVSPEIQVINDVLEGLQILPLSLVDRPERAHPDCYIVLESNFASGSRNYPVAKALIRLAPYTVDVRYDSALQTKLNPANELGTDLLGLDVTNLVKNLRVDIEKRSDYSVGLHLEAVFRSLTTVGRTPKEALHQFVKQNPLLHDDARKKMLETIAALSNKKVSKKLAPPKPTKATKAKNAEHASPDEQADALRNIVAPVLALPPVAAAPVAAEEAAELVDELSFEW